MSAGAGDPEAGSEDATPDDEVGASSARDVEKTDDRDRGARAVPAGRVGRAHGLDGSFYVTGARTRLLAVGGTVRLDDRTCTVVRRAGTDEHPIVRLEEVEDRPAAEALRGRELTVELAQAPALQDGEWWAQELAGCEVVDGERHVGTVVGLMELPSCEALEVQLVTSEADGQYGPAGSSAAQLLVPMVSDAIRHVDPKRRRIDVNMAFVGED
ncbi:MAG TPA: ribosome maturation factor RimM [Solirubrobacteraceae bacterium]|nr:ribosome maturation factor RimM [Solirubrobacteraceae bacterium]